MKIILLFLLTSFTVLGQNIKGTVLDLETKTPIHSVSIYLENRKEGSITNEKGEFILKLNQKLKAKDTILVSCIGYSSKTLTYNQLKSKNYIILLAPKSESIAPVYITSERELKPKLKFKMLGRLKEQVYAFGSLLIDSKIYISCGDRSYIEDNGKRALIEIQNMPNATFGDLLRRMRINPTFESYDNSLQIYDITNNSWKLKEKMFEKRAYHNTNYIDGNLYNIGGKHLSFDRKKEYLDNTIEVYNIVTDSVQIDYTNPHQAVNFASFSFNKNIIVMGGSVSQNKKGTKKYSKKVHMYNTETGYWYELPEMLSPKEVNVLLLTIRFI
ncbi:carboxypeptidase-like regulatory domain-containing protein [Seonamhaeicola sp. ML3]|uniref:carboxypeptidase-like regulatory domain-containing protein n=1 Tax=Seonamhaeicola sp. ML3 TaxID=2937786 RepID=UPI00200C0E0E|nr:carboxypeptidase-like regulatory domain-containing protein [Seonamhaeicola sp. ML3]